MYGYASSTAEAQDGMCSRATPNVLGAVGAGSAFDLSPQRPLRARRDENSITLCRKVCPSDGRRLRVLGGCSSPISQRGVTLEPGGDALTVTPQPLVGGLLISACPNLTQLVGSGTRRGSVPPLLGSGFPWWDRFGSYGMQTRGQPASAML